MKTIFSYFLLPALLLIIHNTSAQQYYGREKAIITLEGRNDYSSFVYVADPIDIKILDSFGSFQFNFSINNCRGRSQRDSLPMLSTVFQGDKFPNIVFSGILPANLISGDAGPEQIYYISGEMVIGGTKRIFPINMKLWIKDKELGYSFAINQDLKGFNLVVPNKYRRVLSGNFSIVSTGGIMILRPD